MKILSQMLHLWTKKELTELEVIRFRIRVQELFEGFVNAAKSGIFPQFGSYFWKKLIESSLN